MVFIRLYGRAYRNLRIVNCRLFSQPTTVSLPFFPLASSNRQVTISDASSSKWATYMNRFKAFIKNDPFMKFSLIFVGVVLSLSLGFEFYLKQQRKKREQSRFLQLLPPKPLNTVVQRRKHLGTIAKELQSPWKTSTIPSALFITGPHGSGKTELARQYSEMFLKSNPLKPSKPLVLTVTATTKHSLINSLSAALHSTGMSHAKVEQTVQSAGDFSSTFETRSKVAFGLLKTFFDSSKSPCLLVVDDLTEETFDVFRRYISQCKKATVLVTTRMDCNKGAGDWQEYSILDISLGLSEEEANSFLETPNRKKALRQLFERGCHLPLNLALYSHLLETSKSIEIPSLEELKLRSDETYVTKELIRYLLHNCYTNKEAKEFLNLLLLCDPNFNVPFTVIEACLKEACPQNHLSDIPLEPTKTKDLVSPNIPHSMAIVQSLQNSPLVTFVERNGEVRIQLSSVVHSILNATETKAMLQEPDHVSQKSSSTKAKSWLFTFRSNQDEHVLPGIKEGYLNSKSGVPSKQQFMKESGSTTESDYQQLLSVLSRNHRVLKSLSQSMLQNTPREGFASECILPHVLYLLRHTPLSRSDKARALSLLSSDHSRFTLKETEKFLEDSQSLYMELNGFYHITVAEVMMNKAAIHYAKGDYIKAKECLTQSLNIHERLPPWAGGENRMLYFANTLSSLGVVHSALLDWERSQENLEKAVEVYKMIPAISSSLPSSFPRDAATTMTDLGHTYLRQGKFSTAKKILDQALVAHKNLQLHKEVIRTLTLLSLLNALCGNHEEAHNFESEVTEVKKEMHVSLTMYIV